MSPIDILILSNGPGEITTWVLPVIKQLRAKLGDNPAQVRISLVLSPCPHGTGQEAAIASKYPEIDRVQAAEHFFPFLLGGKTAQNWDWRPKGMVIFLGGDQFYTLVMAKRLGYRSLVYAEWEARWYRFIDYFGVMKQDVIDRLPPQYRNKCTVVGDLMADVESPPTALEKGKQKGVDDGDGELIGLLPGSKANKLIQGVPFTLAIAEYIHQQRPQTKFIIPVAPTIDIQILAKYANPQENSFVNQLGGVTGQLITTNSEQKERAFLHTSGGVNIELITQFPCHEILKKCRICLTTVGANTAQLGSLAVPMIVLLPSYQLEAMNSWDGLPGLLANLPLVGTNLVKLINWLAVQYILKTKHLYAWPNLWAKKDIVPELIGHLRAENVGNMVLNYLKNPETLEEMKRNLIQVRGNAGAAAKIAHIVRELISDS
jgi:lipid-A-disaccharide synthase